MRDVMRRLTPTWHALLPGLVMALTMAFAGCSNSSGGSSAAMTPDPSGFLAVPDSQDGIQLTISGFEVPAHGENEVCQKFTLPNDRQLEIGGFEQNMPSGSHHFAVYAYNGDSAQLYPDGVFKSTGCMGAGPPDRMALTQVAGAGTTYIKTDYPVGTGVVLQPHQTVLLNSHYANSSDDVLHPTAYVNLYYAKEKIQHPLEAFAISNYEILIPPGSRRTATAQFTVPFDLKIVTLGSHEHKRGEIFTMRVADGTIDHPEGDKVGTNLNDNTHPNGSDPAPGDFYRSENWQHPTMLTYDQPRLVRAGTVLEFSCTQHNDKPVPLRFGPLSDDEMCFITGFYYRAEGAPPPGAVTPGCLPEPNQLSCGAKMISNVDPGGDPVPTPVPVQIGGELAAITDEIFAPSCALPSCHSSATKAGALVLEPDSVYDELVGVSPLSTAARQAGLLRVNPGDPDSSFLMLKLEGELAQGEGSAMPLTGPPLEDDKIERIRAWIAAGAPPR